jgi:UDP-2-acetamido-3-amino-2,3-dideoxy-glucuronate N-acetyltransferase
MAHDLRAARDLALIGAGDWGKNLARCFDGLGALGTLIAYESSELELEELRRQYPNVRSSASVPDALNDPAITKLAIAAPAAVHFELAQAGLLAGKHVFVEKPLCLRLDHAKRLVELARSSGKTLMVGHLLQYHPSVVKLRELVEAGVLGRLLTITSNRLNLGKFRSEENALWSFAPHDVSVILSLLGGELPESVRCVGSAYLKPSVADSTLTIMRFAGDVMAQIHVSWLNPFKEQKLTIVGTDGMAVFDDALPWSNKLTLYRHYLSRASGQEPVPLKVLGEPVLVEETEPLRAECEHFLTSCRAGLRPRTDGAEGVRVLTVLDMAQRSLERDGDAVTPGVERRAQPARDFFAHPSASIDAGAAIGQGTRIWHYCHVMSGARIGERCSFGQNVSVAGGAVVGSDVKVQNNVSLYAGTVLEDDVFLGPSCVLTNVTNPRAQVNRQALYEKTLVRRGATVGANATVVSGVTLGRYSFIAAGAVVVKDVPDYALMVGNPARQQGYMSRHGHRLEAGLDGVMVCPEHGLRYRELEPGKLRCLDLDEDAPLPEALRRGTQSYDELKARPSSHRLSS